MSLDPQTKYRVDALADAINLTLVNVLGLVPGKETPEQRVLALYALMDEASRIIGPGLMNTPFQCGDMVVTKVAIGHRVAPPLEAGPLPPASAH